MKLIRLIKKLLPTPAKKTLRLLKVVLVDNPKKKRVIKNVKQKQGKLVKNLKNKKSIRILFLVKVQSVWKVDEVFKKMLNDKYFEPYICIVPYTAYGEQRLWQEQEACAAYFKLKGYPILELYNIKTQEWLPLSTFQPDIIFFTDEHKTTINKYHEEAYQNFLSVYVPYYFMATNHVGRPSKLHQLELVNCLWRYYLPHQPAQDEYSSFCLNDNSLVTGYPSCEPLVDNRSQVGGGIVWAPHHTIDETKLDSLSTFLTYHSFMQKMARKYNHIKWIFKPHPSLKNKVSELWGEQQANEYWAWWTKQNNTSFNNGEYIELFKKSDAIIHDCSSFIAEYAFTKKPALYLLNKNQLRGLLNGFGKEVIKGYCLAENTVQIEEFVQQVIKGIRVSKYVKYFDSYIVNYYINGSPSELIINDIKSRVADS